MNPFYIPPNAAYEQLYKMNVLNENYTLCNGKSPVIYFEEAKFSMSLAYGVLSAACHTHIFMSAKAKRIFLPGQDQTDTEKYAEMSIFCQLSNLLICDV